MACQLHLTFSRDVKPWYLNVKKEEKRINYSHPLKIHHKQKNTNKYKSSLCVCDDEDGYIRSKQRGDAQATQNQKKIGHCHEYVFNEQEKKTQNIRHIWPPRTSFFRTQRMGIKHIAESEQYRWPRKVPGIKKERKNGAAVRSEYIELCETCEEPWVPRCDGNGAQSGESIERETHRLRVTIMRPERNMPEVPKPSMVCSQ